MPDLPYRAIDPLMGTPLRSPNAAASRSLEQRLKDRGQRSTPQGTFKTDADGHLEFVPKMVADAAAHAAGVPQPTHNQQVLEQGLSSFSRDLVRFVQKTRCATST